MRVPLGWLNELVSVEAPPAEVAERLTLAGLEVEALLRVEPAFSGVIAGRVTKVERHPNADRLSVCEVDAGAEGSFVVVCGAPNVRAGMVSAFARVGARLAAGAQDGAPAKENPGAVKPLEAAVIRGVQSQGMLCSERELGLSDDHAGIVELDAGAAPGQEVAALLGLPDTVLDVAVTPNRGDCLSILGIAREVAALFDGRGRLKRPPRGTFTELASAGTGAPAPLSVEIDAPALCPRYAALAMSGLQVARAPAKARTRLRLCGMRPVNNVVDVTNYVMLEQGQPLHAFDLDRIAERRIIVRTAGETHRRVLTLDNISRSLEPAQLVIADPKEVLGIAGVMGGLGSAVTATTSAIVLESAYFDPQAVTRASRRLGLRSEASRRFEYGVDRQGQVTALRRAAALLKGWAGARVLGPVVDAEVSAPAPREIALEMRAVGAMLGAQLKAAVVRRRLRAIGARLAPAGRATLRVTVPSYRADLAAVPDLVEEVARLSGFAEVAPRLPARSFASKRPERRRAMMRAMREVLVGCGLTEVRTLALVAADDNRRYPGRGFLSESAPCGPVGVENPLSAELAELRESLVSGLVRVLRFNLNRQAGAFHAFEVGKVFFRGHDGPAEGARVAAISYGPFAFEGPGGDQRSASFATLKGVCETLIQAFGLGAGLQFVAPGRGFSPTGAGGSATGEPALAVAVPFLHPRRSAFITRENRIVGLLGELHPEEALRLELDQPAVVFELDLALLLAYGLVSSARVEPPPRFPAVRRDVALVVSRETPAGEIVSEFRAAGPEALERAEVTDVYEGVQVAEGRKSVTLSCVYRSRERSLTDEEVNRMHAELTARVLSRLGAQLRG